MINKKYIMVISASLLVGELLNFKVNAITLKPNSVRVSNSYNIIVNKEKFDEFWTSENESFLTSEDKEKINQLRTKSENGEILSGSEKSLLKSMKVEVIRKKLGEEKFNELQKLIEKREGSIDLTLPERARLYQLDKEATGK
ncbi:hypothetical protein JCM1393_26950 [Clostridium carnis]